MCLQRSRGQPLSHGNVLTMLFPVLTPRRLFGVFFFVFVSGGAVG